MLICHTGGLKRKAILARIGMLKVLNNFLEPNLSLLLPSVIMETKSDGKKTVDVLSPPSGFMPRRK